MWLSAINDWEQTLRDVITMSSDLVLPHLHWPYVYDKICFLPGNLVLAKQHRHCQVDLSAYGSPILYQEIIRVLFLVQRVQQLICVDEEFPSNAAWRRLNELSLWKILPQAVGCGGFE